MFRSAVLAAVVVAAPFIMSASAHAQSLVAVDVVAPASSAPISITQRYVPTTAVKPRTIGLLVGEPVAAVTAPPASVASISVTSNVPGNMARMAVNDLGVGRSTIVVSDVGGVRE